MVFQPTSVSVAMRVLLASVLVLIGCSSRDDSSVTLRVWHFWSEPSQERAFRRIVAAFERRYGVRVELTPLQWSDGKAKLQIAFSSGSPPDVVHLGAEWVAEFAPAVVPLDSTFDAALRAEFAPIGRVNGRRYALPWTVNARVLLVHRRLGMRDGDRWSEFVARVRAFHVPPERFGIGLCTSDPHNVLKRDLPLLWAAGAHLFRSLPIAATADSSLVGALGELAALVPYAVVEPSRQLDERLRRGQIGAALSGMWMLGDSAVLATYDVAGVVPHRSGADGSSILSGDCFAIARASARRREAKEFLAFLGRWELAAAFCRDVPDAGFPAQQPPSQAALDSLVGRSQHWRNAYQQTLHSVLLPSPPYFLDAERIVEETITAVLYGTLDPLSARRELLRRLRPTW